MKFKVAFILILVVSSVFAQSELRSRRPLRLSTPQPEEVNKEAYSKIPDEYRSSVENTINRKASMVADAETVNKFNIEIDPKVWTNNCGRGVIYYNGGCWHKYDKDGRLIQFGNEKEFEELIWCNKRKNELIVEFWKDNKIVDNALSNAVKNASANVLRSSNLSNRGSLLSRRMLRRQNERESQGQRQEEIIKERERRRKELESRFKEEERRRQEEAAEEERKKEAAKKVVDAKIDTFLKEYLGVQFGDSIEKFETHKDLLSYDFRIEIKEIPVLKKIKHFDKAMGFSLYGKLYKIIFYCEIDKKYSENSVDQQIEQDLVDIFIQFGFQSDISKGAKALLVDNLTSYDLNYYKNNYNCWRRGVEIIDYRVQKKVDEQEKAKGETFPEAK